jgi:hypothetical protein
MSGLRAVIASIQPYKERSTFIDIIEEEQIISDEMQPLPPTSNISKLPSAEDIEALDSLHAKLLEVREYVTGHQAEENLLDQILEFVTMLQAKVPIMSPHEQFTATKTVRTAMAAVPVAFMRRVRREPETMIAATYFFVTVLVTQPVFPAMGIMVCFARRIPIACADDASSSLAWPFHPSEKFKDTWKSSEIIPFRP